MKRICFLIFLLVGIWIASLAEASPVEEYQRILAGNKLTIKYESIVPLDRTISRNKLDIHGKSGMNLDNAHFLTNRQFKGLVVIDGENKYEELSSEKLSICRLIKDGQVFFFSKEIVDGKIVYYGNSGKGKVSPSGRNVLAEYFEGGSYGDRELSRCLNALLPLELIPATLPYYERIKTGKLQNNSYYEDYYTNINNYEEGIRFYFDENKMVKIKSLSLSNDIYSGEEICKKVIIKIDEFTDRVDSGYLELPLGIKNTGKY